MSAADFTGFVEALGRRIVYHPSLARLLGSLKAAIFLEQLMYWTPRAKDRDGWVYKTAVEWEEETGLTYEEQKLARKILRKHGVMEERRARIEHRLYFRVNRQALNALWAAEGSVKILSRQRGKPSLGNEGNVSSLLPEMTSQSTSKTPLTPISTATSATCRLTRTSNAATVVQSFPTGQAPSEPTRIHSPVAKC
jgi:hypothetical protein